MLFQLRLEGEALIERPEVLPLDYVAGRSAALIMGDLYRKGEPVDALDVFTAAIGLRDRCKVVLTRNRRHFERFPGIDVETY